MQHIQWKQLHLVRFRLAIFCLVFHDISISCFYYLHSDSPFSRSMFFSTFLRAKAFPLYSWLNHCCGANDERYDDDNNRKEYFGSWTSSTIIIFLSLTLIANEQSITILSFNAMTKHFGILIGVIFVVETNNASGLDCIWDNVETLNVAWLSMNPPTLVGQRRLIKLRHHHGLIPCHDADPFSKP